MVLNSTPPKTKEKLSLGERWNRTRKKMSKHFSANSPCTYLPSPVLTELVHQYNSNRHSSTKMTPIVASQKEHETKVYWNMKGDLQHMQQP